LLYYGIIFQDTDIHGFIQIFYRLFSW